MTSYMQGRAERIEKARIKKQQEIEDFLNSVNVLHNNIDSVVIPSVGIIKETEKCYLDYYIAKYPNCLVYKLLMKRKDHPFDIYYSKEFYKRDIPAKYSKVFEELEQYFK